MHGATSYSWVVSQCSDLLLKGSCLERGEAAAGGRIANGRVEELPVPQLPELFFTMTVFQCTNFVFPVF